MNLWPVKSTASTVTAPAHLARAAQHSSDAERKKQRNEDKKKKRNKNEIKNT
jgi:hypothetical protein